MPFENLAILTGSDTPIKITTASSTFIAEEPCRTRRRLHLRIRKADSTTQWETGDGARNSDYNLFAQRLELRYTGIKDWLFYAEGEWEEENGNVNEFQSIDEEIPLDKNTNALGQKYTVGATWNPTMRFSLAGQYFHRIASYNEEFSAGSSPDCSTRIGTSMTLIFE